MAQTTLQFNGLYYFASMSVFNDMTWSEGQKGALAFVDDTEQNGDESFRLFRIKEISTSDNSPTIEEVNRTELNSIDTQLENIRQSMTSIFHTKGRFYQSIGTIKVNTPTGTGTVDITFSTPSASNAFSIIVEDGDTPKSIATKIQAAINNGYIIGGGNTYQITAVSHADKVYFNMSGNPSSLTVSSSERFLLLSVSIDFNRQQNLPTSGTISNGDAWICGQHGTYTVPSVEDRTATAVLEEGDICLMTGSSNDIYWTIIQTNIDKGDLLLREFAKAFSNSVTAEEPTSETGVSDGRWYRVCLDSAEKLVVHVPWKFYENGSADEINIVSDSSGTTARVWKGKTLRDNLVTLATDQTITGEKTFANDINIKHGTGESDIKGIIWQETSGSSTTDVGSITRNSSTDAITINPNISAETPKSLVISASDLTYGGNTVYHAGNLDTLVSNLSANPKNITFNTLTIEQLIGRDNTASIGTSSSLFPTAYINNLHATSVLTNGIADMTGNYLIAGFEENEETHEISKLIIGDDSEGSVNTEIKNLVGTYPNITAGYASNLLVSEVYHDREFYRSTTNDYMSVISSMANINAIYGNTIKFNQLVSNGNFPTTSTSGWSASSLVSSISTANNYLSVTSAANGNITTPYSKSLAGHKVLLLFTAYSDTADSALQARLFQGSAFTSADFTLGTTPTLYGKVLNISNTDPSPNTRLYFIFNTADTFHLTNIQTFDLTAMGREDITTVAAFQAEFPESYYAYTSDKGILVNNAVEDLMTNGYQQWDEEWEVGTINTATGQNASANNRIRSKNYISVFPSTNYYFKSPYTTWFMWYDANKNFISEDGNRNSVNTSPSNAAYLRIVISGTTYNNDICINFSWTGYRNGEYEQYWQNDKQLNLTSIYGKLNGTGDSVQIFPNGLMKAGTVFDVLYKDRAVKRLKMVNLGDLTWVQSATNTSGKYRFEATLSDAARPANGGVAFNGVCSKYIATSTTDTYVCTTGIAKSANNDSILIYDETYATSTEADFQSAISGVYLIYELAEYENYTLDTELDLDYPVEDFGTEWVEPRTTDAGLPATAPFSAQIQYVNDFARDIANLPNDYVRKTVYEAAIADIQANKANIDGSYATLTAGDLVDADVTAVDREIVFNPMTSYADFENGTAQLHTIQGKSVIWNQLVYDDFSSRLSAFGTVVKDGNKYTITTTSIGQYGNVQLSSIPSVVGHKYYIRMNVLQNTLSTDLYITPNITSISTSALPIYHGVTGLRETIVTKTSTAENKAWALMIFAAQAEGATLEFGSLQIYDLTLMFGTGYEPSSVEEFKALFPNNYYSYNDGTPLHFKGTQMVTNGFNQWDEQWQIGYWGGTDGIRHESSTIHCSVNPIKVKPNTNYYRCANNKPVSVVYFDANMKVLGFSMMTSDAVFKTPANCHYIHINLENAYGQVYQNNVCINLSDTSKNGTYEPYEEHSLDTSWIYDIEDGNGNKPFADGLKSVGNVHDEVTETRLIQRVGVINMSELNWSMNADGNFDAAVEGMKQGVAAVACSKYATILSTPSSQTTDDKSVWSNASSNYIHARDSICLTLQAFEQGIADVKLYYELATPITYNYTKKDFNYFASKYGTEKLVPVNGTTPTTTPAFVNVSYGINNGYELRNLYNNFVNYGALDKFKVDLTDEYDDRFAAINGSTSEAFHASTLYEGDTALSSKYALQDGSYSTLTAGDLVDSAITPTDREFFMDATKDYFSEADGTAKIDTIKGKSIIWHQKVTNGNFDGNINNWSAYSGTYASVAYGSNSIIATIISTDSTYGYAYGIKHSTFGEGIVTGHKVLASYSVKSSVAMNFSIEIGGISAPSVNVAADTFTRVSGIITIGSTAGTDCIVKPASDQPMEVGQTYEVKDVNIFDLTLMFGNGNEPETVDDFRKLFYNPYYYYNVGTPLNFKATSLVSRGFNQWDEEWENKIWATNGTKLGDPQRICSKNMIPVLPNTVYYSTSRLNILFFNESLQFIYETGFNGPNVSFVTPGTARYMVFNRSANLATTYNNDICINISDSTKNGTYEPYKKEEIDLSWIYTMNSGMFSDGLKKAGTAYDEVGKTRAVKRLGVYTFTGNEGWSRMQQGDIYLFNLSLPSDAITSGNNLLCSKYATTDVSTFATMENKSIKKGSTFIRVRDDSYGDANAFAPTLAGVKLIYELASPVTYNYDERDLEYFASKYGTEAILPVNGAAPTTTPANMAIEYGLNYGYEIRNLYNNFLSAGSIKSFKVDVLDVEYYAAFASQTAMDAVEDELAIHIKVLPQSIAEISERVTSLENLLINPTFGSVTAGKISLLGDINFNGSILGTAGSTIGTNSNRLAYIYGTNIVGNNLFEGMTSGNNPQPIPLSDKYLQSVTLQVGDTASAANDIVLNPASSRITSTQIRNAIGLYWNIITEPS